MNATISLNSANKCLNNIAEGNHARDKAVKLYETLSATNLLTARQLRALIRAQVPSLLNSTNVSDVTTSAYLCAALFQVLAIEQAYCDADTESTRLGGLIEVSADTFAPLLHFCDYLLNLFCAEEALPSAIFVKQMRMDGFYNLDDSYKQLLFSLIANHIVPLAGALSPRSLQKLVKAANKWNAENEITARLNTFVNASAETSDNDQVDGVGEKFRMRGLSWAQLLDVYATRGAKTIARGAVGLTDEELVQLVRALDLTQVPRERYPDVLCIIAGWFSTRHNLQFPITESVCALMMGDGESKAAAMRLMTALFSEKSTLLFTDITFLNFCMSLVRPPTSTDTTIRLPWAIALTKFLTTIVKNAPKQRIGQHALVAGYMSELLTTLHTCRKAGADLEHDCLILEHHLKTLCRVASKDDGLNWDLPYVIANNLRAERRPSAPIMTCLANFTKHQMAFLSTNLPPTERQMFATIQRASQLAE